MNDEYNTRWEWDEKLMGRVVPYHVLSIPDTERLDDFYALARVQYRIYEGPKRKKVYTTFNWGAMEAFLFCGWKPHYSFDNKPPEHLNEPHTEKVIRTQRI